MPLVDSSRNLTVIETVIKPHTRAHEADQFGNYPLPDISYVLAASLCEWTDVLLVVVPSVMAESLMRGKPALYLKCLHDNTTLFEELGACWTNHDETELKMAILNFSESLQNSLLQFPDTGPNPKGIPKGA